MKEKIESLVFQKKSKDELIEDILASLSGLLADVFTGDDVNQLKKELPEGIQVEDIGVQLKSTSVYLDSREFDVPCIEVAIDLIVEKSQYEIGTYSLIFNEDLAQVDEILNIN